MVVERKLYRRENETKIFSISLLYRLEGPLLFVSPMNFNIISDQIVEKVDVTLKGVDIATVKSRTCQNFHDVTFSLRRFKILQVFKLARKQLYPVA